MFIFLIYLLDELQKFSPRLCITLVVEVQGSKIEFISLDTPENPRL